MKHHYIVWFGATIQDNLSRVTDVIADHVNAFEQYAPYEILHGVTPTWPTIGNVLAPGVLGSNEQRSLTSRRDYVCVKAYVVSELAATTALDRHIQETLHPSQLWMIEKVSELEIITQLLEEK